MASKKLIVERGVRVPMRDGVGLAADIYRPDTPERLPVLLQRTPYGRGFAGTGFALWAAENDYAVVLQDTRGRWASEGDSYPFISEKDDGYDTVEWAARQPWANGKVGMYGESYLGYTQFAAAHRQPPALKALIPSFTFSDPYSFLYQGGALNLGAAVSWSLLAGAQMAIMRLSDSGLLSIEEAALYLRQFIELVDEMASGTTFQRLPLKSLPLVGEAGLLPILADALAHPERDGHWQRVAIDLHRVQVPALHFGGWYDIFTAQTLSDFSRLKESGAPGQRAIIGPWVHANIDSLAGEVDFGLQASGMILLPDELQLSWFDRWLKDEPNQADEQPPLRLFVMGSNQWRDEQEWPLARTAYQPYYLHSGGSANTRQGDGSLSPAAPQEEAVDTYIYDPRSPTPTRGGGLCCWNPALPPGAFDQRPIEDRPDVLVYTTPPLLEDLEVTGPVKLFLWAASSAPDTDFTAQLVEVSPAGFARNLCGGILRACRRPGAEGPLMPGQPYLFEIDLGPTSNLFKAGWRLRLDLASSSFPRYDRNPNTGSDPQQADDLQPALQTVFHEAGKPSHLLLPVIEK